MKVILIVVLLTLGYLYGMSKLEVMYRGDLARLPTIVHPGNGSVIEDKNAALEISISGAVVQPGKYSLKSGSTLQELITQAGGLKEDADHNTYRLSYLLTSTQSIYIGFENGGNKISINTSPATTLAILPGIGTVIAQRIIDYRIANGQFDCLDNIKKVSGIGDAVFAKIRELIRL